ncbi:hypothetical protein IV102_05105 [bacterium]|nr:hypothetical protein [bacterium]
MRKTLYCLLLALWVVPALVGAKVVNEGAMVFSVDIPDAWKLDAKANAWSNSNNSGALLLRSAPVKLSLEEWAKLSTAKTPKGTVVSKDKLGAVDAKRLEFVGAEGYKTTIWIAKKGPKGAIITLVHNSACPDKIPDIKKKLISSFKWK